MIPGPQRWVAIRTPEPEREYVALLSMFAMKSPLHVPAFAKLSNRIQEQVTKSPGAMGVRLAADILHLKFFTLSAWESREQLDAFINAGPHAGAMTSEPPHLRRRAVFVFYTATGAELPPDWDAAMRRFNEHEAANKR